MAKALYKRNLTKRFLNKHYIIKKKSIPDIALQTNIPLSTISRYLKKHNIKTRTIKEATKGLSLGKKFSKKHKHNLSYSMRRYRKTEWEAILNGTIYLWRKWKLFKQKILKRDKYKCLICGKKANTIHHKKPKKEFPELCWKPNNVVSICQKCHTKIENPNSPKTNTQIKQIKNLKEKIKNIEKKFKKYKKLAMIDDLTQLYNHRKLYHDINRYFEIQKRHGIEFYVMIIDIDNFKKINDLYGHQKGDEILIELSKVLKRSIRKYDKLYRNYTGDEFVIIFSHSKDKKTLPSRIKKNLKQLNVIVSIGVCKLGKNCLRKADRRMYAEKRRHKNMQGM